MTEQELSDSLEIIEIKPGKRFSLQLLREILPDTETALFFGKVYELDYVQLSNLLSKVLQSDVAKAIFNGSHSTSLQDYLSDGLGYDTSVAVRKGSVEFNPVLPPPEFLPQLWASLEIEVAQSIKDVAAKLESVVGMMPGKKANMVIDSMMKLNLRRPTIGVTKAKHHRPPQKQNLIILDDSGSVSRPTVAAILGDVVNLAYMANAHLALVSNDTRVWEPGTYGVQSVLAEVQGGGTNYHTLEDLLNKDWGVVVSIADYDSRVRDKEHIARKCSGFIDELVDISLVSSRTYLAECVGQRAAKVRPLLIATGGTPRQSFGI